MCYTLMRRHSSQQESVERNVTTAGSSDTTAPAAEGIARPQAVEPAYAGFRANLQRWFASRPRKHKETVA